MPENTPAYSKDLLLAGLRELGVARGDVLMIHSSASSVGSIKELMKAPDTGMRWLLDALLEAVGPDGLIAVPTFTKTFKSESDGPIGDVWNPKKSHSRVGSFTNYVWEQPGAARSDHPTHSIAAIGRRAADFCAGHSWREGATTFDRRGPWGKLVDWNGKILWIGTAMKTQTAVHTVEEWMKLPYMATCIALVDDNGKTREVPVLQSPAGPRDFYRDGSKSELAWNAAGLARRGKVGKADAQLMGAAQFIDWLWAALLKDPALLLKDKPDDVWSVKAKADTAAHLRNFKGGWRR
ncbi:MAG TPA: AAC(3) family N-acetyltransferase [Planctomycetota bacterium]|nr:AAC(3) family N-acetyltransferase [Planctomycetota bacterium]